jgi:hypothetical protein
VESNYDLTNSGAVSLSNDDIASTKGVTLVDVQIFGNEKTGLYIRSNGPVALLGVESSYNSIYSGWIDEDSSTNGVRERLSGYWGSQGDEWHFMGETGDSYTIALTSSEFTPVLVLTDEWGNILEMDDPGTGDTAKISYPIAYDGEYILRVMASDWGFGVYELTFGGNLYDWLDSTAYYGANIVTSNSVRISSGKTIFSNFNNNNADGAYIECAGTVTISNTGASMNYWDGLDIAPPSGNVSISNNHKTRMSMFNGNTLGSGIIVESSGTVTLNNRIIANGNGSYGIYVTNDGSVLKSISVKGVAVSANYRDGLYVNATGNITLAAVEANDNNGNGVNAIINSDGSLTISGVNVFSFNGNAGLLYNVWGSVNISGVTADYNGTDGIAGYARETGKTVTIKNSLLRWNARDGLWFHSAGNITLDGVQSLMNGGDGVDIDPTYSITTVIKNSAFMGNGEYGIKVLVGYYTITNTFYLANDWGGIFLYH